MKLKKKKMKILKKKTMKYQLKQFLILHMFLMQLDNRLYLMKLDLNDGTINTIDKIEESIINNKIATSKQTHITDFLNKICYWSDHSIKHCE